jgi:hypothetical protein
MNHIKQKISFLIFGLLLSTSALVVAPAAVHADCGGVKTAIINCSQAKGAKTAETSPIWGVLLIVLNIMTAGVGIVAVGGIVYGAILYASAGDKAEQTKKAVGIITNVAIGIAAYGLMYVFLNFLVPGGVFS